MVWSSRRANLAAIIIICVVLIAGGSLVVYENFFPKDEGNDYSYFYAAVKNRFDKDILKTQEEMFSKGFTLDQYWYFNNQPYNITNGTVHENLTYLIEDKGAFEIVHSEDGKSLTYNITKDFDSDTFRKGISMSFSEINVSFNSLDEKFTSNTTADFVIPEYMSDMQLALAQWAACNAGNLTQNIIAKSAEKPCSFYNCCCKNPETIDQDTLFKNLESKAIMSREEIINATNLSVSSLNNILSGGTCSSPGIGLPYYTCRIDEEATAAKIYSNIEKDYVHNSYKSGCLVDPYLYENSPRVNSPSNFCLDPRGYDNDASFQVDTNDNVLDTTSRVPIDVFNGLEEGYQDPEMHSSDVESESNDDSFQMYTYVVHNNMNGEIVVVCEPAMYGEYNEIQGLRPELSIKLHFNMQKRCEDVDIIPEFDFFQCKLPDDGGDGDGDGDGDGKGVCNDLYEPCTPPIGPETGFCFIHECREGGDGNLECTKVAPPNTVCNYNVCMNFLCKPDFTCNTNPLDPDYTKPKDDTTVCQIQTSQCYYKTCLSGVCATKKFYDDKTRCHAAASNECFELYCSNNDDGLCNVNKSVNQGTECMTYSGSPYYYCQQKVCDEGSCNLTTFDPATRRCLSDTSHCTYYNCSGSGECTNKGYYGSTTTCKSPGAGVDKCTKTMCNAAKDGSCDTVVPANDGVDCNSYGECAVKKCTSGECLFNGAHSDTLCDEYNETCFEECRESDGECVYKSASTACTAKTYKDLGADKATCYTSTTCSGYSGKCPWPAALQCCPYKNPGYTCPANKHCCSGDSTYGCYNDVGCGSPYNP